MYVKPSARKRLKIAVQFVLLVAGDCFLMTCVCAGKNVLLVYILLLPSFVNSLIGQAEFNTAFTPSVTKVTRAKRIYNLMIKVNEFLFSSRYFLKEIENMFSGEF